MAKAKFDIKTLELPPIAAKPLYAGVGVTDLAVEIVRDYVADVQEKLVGYQKDVQKTVTDFDFKPKALRAQAVSAVNARVESLSKDANARRAAVEARIADLQADAQALPTKVTDTVTDTYGDLAKRGEALVTRIRKQESTKATKATAKTATAKAKTTRTQATKATKSTASTVKKATTTAKKSSAPARSSAKATATAAKKTVSNTAQAATDAAEKVGD